MKLLNAFYSNGIAMYGKAFSMKSGEQVVKENTAIKCFGVKPMSLKQDYKAIETHKYTEEELAKLEVEKIKREIEAIKQDLKPKIQALKEILNKGTK